MLKLDLFEWLNQDWRLLALLGVFLSTRHEHSFNMSSSLFLYTVSSVYGLHP